MEKWSGSIGFATDVDNGFGIHSEQIVEYPYQGNLLRVYQTNTNSTSVNADVNLSLKINIVASAYLNRNISKIRYITFHGEKWTVKNVEPIYPTITIEVGSVFPENSGGDV